MAWARDIRVADGRRLRVHASAEPGAARRLTIVWHHGSPQTGALLHPLVEAAAARDIWLISYARPSYGGSSAQPGRDVASAASDVLAIADALRIDRFAVMGASGGGPHALACAAGLADRVTGAVTLACIAPFRPDAEWFAGMVAPGGLRAAMDGREARLRYAATEQFDETSFTPADWAALSGPWSALGADATQAGGAGPDGLVDDDVAFVSPWGVDLGAIGIPVLLVQGGEDRIVPAAHADWLLHACPSAELWLRPRDGHVSVLGAVPVAMDWLLASDGD